MSKRTALFEVTLVCTIALLVGGGVICFAGEQEGPKEISQLGGPNAFFKVKGGMAAEDFKLMCTEKKEDITTLLYEAGWQWGPEVLFDAVDAGNFSEVEVPVGTELEWMMYRKRGKPVLGYDFIWAGKEPFPAFKLVVKLDDEKNCKDYVYEFIIPKACGNLAMYAMEVKKYKAEVSASLSATPDSACVCQDLVLDATGCSATMKGREVLDKVMAKVILPDGTEQGMGVPDTSGVYRWNLNYRKPGTYKFEVIAVAKDCDNTSAEASAVFEALPCPPVCDLSIAAEGLEEFYTKEELEVDASGSEAKAGSLEKVALTVSLDGSTLNEQDLTGEFITTVSYTQPGEYKFTAIAFDDCDQQSDNSCEDSVTVLSRWLPFVSILGGKMRRSVWPEEHFEGHCEPLAAVKAGIGYMVIPRKFEISGALGYAFAIDNSDYSSLFADVYFNYLRRPWMVGAGLGYWDLADSDTDDINFLIHGGYDLPWKIHDKPVQFVTEGRLFLDETDDLSNNYALLGGLKFNF